MKEEIRQLIDLQAVDAEIAGFDAAITSQKKMLASREKSIHDKESAIAACQKKQQLLLALERETKIENEDAGARIKDRQNKMMQVQTSREHQALLKEIEDSKKLLRETEEKVLEIMEQVEQLKTEETELDNLRKGEKELLQEETGEVEKEIRKIENTRKKVNDRRKVLARALTSSLLKRYDKLLKKRDGLAVVQVVEAVCQGCFMTIPPQKFNEVRKNNRLHPCPNCQRIMYFAEEEEAAVE